MCLAATRITARPSPPATECDNIHKMFESRPGEQLEKVLMGGAHRTLRGNLFTPPFSWIPRICHRVPQASF